MSGVIVRFNLSILAVALLVASPSWAINKCVSADGKVSYQAQPCAGGTAKTINIKTPPPPVVNSGSSIPQSASVTAQSSDQRALERFARDRRIREITYQIAGLEQDVDQRNQRMEAEMNVLKGRKSLANNNLAGATYQQSLSVEMQAVATRYKAQNDADFERIKALRAELATLEAGKP